MKLKFIEVETAIKIKLCAIVEKLKQRSNRAERVSNFEKRLYRGGRKRVIYTIPANAKESIN